MTPHTTTKMTAALAFALAAVAAPAIAQDTKPETQPAATAKDLPTAESVIERAVDAMGGREALTSVESIMLKGEMSTPMGAMSIEMRSASGDRFHIKQSIPSVGDITIGSDGTTGWMNHPMMGGLSLLDPEQMEEMKGQANMYEMVVRIEDDYETHKIVDQTEFRGRDCYKMHVTKEDESAEDIFFDTETGLIAGLETTQDQGMGEVPIVIGFEDWKQFGDIKGFTKMAIDQMGMSMEMTFSEVKINEVEDSVFALPDGVSKLIEEQKAPTTAPDAQPAGE